MITEDDIERVLYHPLFRQRILSVLRKHGLLPELARNTDDDPLYPLKRGYKRKDDPGLEGGTEIPLEDLGIYLTVEDACKELKVDRADLIQAIHNRAVRAKRPDMKWLVEKDSVIMWNSGRERWLEQQEKEKSRIGRPPSEERIGLHIVTPAAKARRALGITGNMPTTPRPKGGMSHQEAAVELDMKIQSIAPMGSNKVLERIDRGWVSKESVMRYKRTRRHRRKPEKQVA